MSRKHPPGGKGVNKGDVEFVAATVVPGIVSYLARTGTCAEDLEPLPMPGMPPKTLEEAAADAEICRRLNELAAFHRQENLNNAVRLAQMAARGHGPLVDYFAELGRRYTDLAERGPPKPRLRVIDGGDA